MKTKTPKTRNTKGQRGFTIIETTIASLVMMVGALAVSSLFVFSTQNNVGGSERALAMAVAQQQLEQIRSVSYEDATLIAGTTNLTARSGGRDYTVQRVVADEMNADNSPKQLKRITISVTPSGTGVNWTRTPVVLVTFRSTLTAGNFAVSE
jgi:Tfp pilus assembly protein PilV